MKREYRFEDGWREIPRYVVRFAYRQAHGWAVRVPGSPHAYFSDLNHGGIRPAFDAAVALRNQVMAELGLDGAIVRERNPIRQEMVDKVHVTGMAGVQCSPVYRHGHRIAWMVEAAVSGWREWCWVGPRSDITVEQAIGRARRRRRQMLREWRGLTLAERKARMAAPSVRLQSP